MTGFVLLTIPGGYVWVAWQQGHSHCAQAKFLLSSQTVHIHNDVYVDYTFPVKGDLMYLYAVYVYIYIYVGLLFHTAYLANPNRQLDRLKCHMLGRSPHHLSHVRGICNELTKWSLIACHSLWSR